MEASVLRTLSRLAMMSTKPIVTWIDHSRVFVNPASISIGSSVFRKFTCVPGCFACCLQGPLTLDFIPTEQAWIQFPEHLKPLFSERIVQVNGVSYPFWSLDKPKGMCHFLSPREGGQGCGVWNTHPLECFAAARLQIQKRGEEAIILKKGFAREWRWETHAQCRYDEPFKFEESEFESDFKVLSRYIEWAEYFHIPTVLSDIIGLITIAYDHKKIPSTLKITLR
jgi:hypothetical protein